MPLTRLDNLLSSKTGKYIYVSPDDFNASDALDNRGNSPTRPFITIQRAFLEVARYSYVPGIDNDRFDQFTIMLAPGTHYIDNRPGTIDTSDTPVFNFDAIAGEWNDNTILDLSNPNNVFYKFNGKDGGATIPRGTSLVGTDLRRTQVRALYIPDPADKDVPRCALFNVTGGCYFWQFTILDSNPESGPLNGKVYSQPNSTALSTPVFSHHKMTNFVFADRDDLSLLYRKISKSFSKYQTAIDDVYASEIATNGGRVSDTWDASTTKQYSQNDTVVFGGNAYKSKSQHFSSSDKRPDKNKTYWEILTTVSREFDYRVQENRIVGPLADTIQLDDITITEPTAGLLTVVVRTKINHNLFPSQSVVIANTGFSNLLHGSFLVTSISPTNPKEFTYKVSATLAQVSFANGDTKIPDATATVQAEVDSVESASPYVFNVSIRSTWGICGIWADGRKATGFKSMVIAQYTGVSLQKDDRAFIRYDEFTNTWNEAPLTDAFASTPYHIKGDAYWKDDWRNFHVRASDDSFIQNVSIFAVGFADHFLLESGGDMSITNSNSNFGNTSMHSKGFKGFAFNQDKGGYITDIIPPKAFADNVSPQKISYYSFDVQLSRGNKDNSGNWLAQPRLYYSAEKANNPLDRPAVSLNGYRLGARTYINSSKAEKIYIKTTANITAGETEPTLKEAYLYPQGFKKWGAALTTLSPDNLGVGNFDNNPITDQTADKAFYNRIQDAANLIDANKTFIQAEAFGYVLEKYPYLQNRSYVNPNISSETGRYRDASNLIKANRQEIIDYAFSQTQTTFSTASSSFTFGAPLGSSTEVIGAYQAKCKRDIGYIVDAVTEDLYDGGNVAIINATKSYFGASAKISAVSRSNNIATITTSTPHNLTVGAVVAIKCNEISEFNNSSATVITITSATTFTYLNAGTNTSNTATGTVSTDSGSPITNGLVGEETQSIFAFNRARDWAKKAISNLLTSKSLLGVTSMTASGTTTTVTVGASTPHGLKVGDTVTIGGATQSGYNGKWVVLSTGLTTTQFRVTTTTTPAASPATGAYYVSTIIIDAQNSLQEAGRYKDASKLVTSNRQEIIDRAFAEVSVQYNEPSWGANWVVPGDTTTDDNNRFRDAYRLIQKNKTEIIDRAFGEIAIQYNEAAWGNNWIVPGDTVSGSLKRYFDSYRLIQRNRNIIVESAYAASGGSIVGDTNGDKCKRDIRLYVDALSLDILAGGSNRYTRKFVQQYFSANGSFISNGLAGEVTQSLTAFAKARDAMKLAITNTLSSLTGLASGAVYTDLTITADPSPSSGSPSNTNPNSCSGIKTAIDTLASIVHTIISNATLNNLPAETTGIVEGAGEIKCKRDIELMIDAISLDIAQSGGSNRYSRKFVQQYFTNSTTPLSSGLLGEEAQSIFAFEQARDMMIKALTNQLYEKDLTISAGPADYNQGANISGDASGNAGSCADVRSAVTTLTALITTHIFAGNLTNLAAETVGSIPAGETKCKRDIGIIVDSVAQDLFWGGNEFTVDAVKEYFINSNTLLTNGLTGEISQSVIAFNMARDIAKRAITNQLYGKTPISAGPARYTTTGTLSTNGVISGISDTSGLQQGASITKIGGNGAFGSNPVISAVGPNQITVTISSGSFTAGSIEFTGGGNITVGLSGNAASCVDVQGTIDSLFGIVSNTLTVGSLTALPNKSNGEWDCANVRSTIDTLFAIPTNIIAAGSLADIPASNPGLWSQISESSKCKRDIGYFVEAIVSDFRLGGNENIVNAAESYYTGTGNYTVSGDLAANGVITGISNTSSLQKGMSVTYQNGAGAFGDNAVISVVGTNQITVTISSGSFTVGSITFTANQLDYIENERVESLDAYDYVKQLMISSMRNHNTYIPTANVSFNTTSSTVTLTGGKTTAGLVVGMKVQSVTTIPLDTGTNVGDALTNYNDAYEEIVNGKISAKASNVTNRISSETYIKKIISATQFELGEKSSKLSVGLTKKPASGASANLFVSLNEGIWSTSLDPSVDNSVIRVYTEYTNANGQCANIKSTLDTYFTYVNTIINNGIGQVARIPSTINTGTFAQRATLFTLTDSETDPNSSTNPHFLQTGTPVRIVPRAKNDNVDSRLVRLPRGFDTNTVYYVIAPGRKTDPNDYSTKPVFNGTTGSLQNLMLATSVENAAAGIFIYSSETESIDPNVQIEIYQYLLDIKYDLSKYEVTVRSSGTGSLENIISSEPHIFDIPTTADTLTDTQKYTSVFFKAISNGLPSFSSSSGGGTLDSTKEYFVRYVNKNEFKIYDTLSNAVNNPGSPLVFNSGFNDKFYVLSSKRRSPLRFDPAANPSLGGTWYLMTDTSKPNTIIERLRADDFAQKDKTPDSWFERLIDDRSKKDRVYRLRYVIPNYLKSVRDPLSGFIIKSRNDSTRRLQPQKILLKPVGSGGSFAQFSITNQFAAATGLSSGQEYLGLDSYSQGPDFVSLYDPYNPELLDPTQPLTSPAKYRIKVTTDAKVTFYVQSARKKRISNKDYLELTVFDIGIEEQGYKQKIFTSVEISPPQGGNGTFEANISNTATTNSISWSGATEGTAKVHAYYNYEGKHYLILKDVNVITSTLEYTPFQTTTFTQGLVASTLLSEPDFGRSSTDRNLYVTEGANVYTMTPGDTLTANNGTYAIASIEDVRDFESTFYIYDIDTIRKRIYGQQDGIYYLTCVKGNVSPYPTGSGVGENFKGYKFSQPISRLYPEFYKDDPEWYKQNDATLIDPPATISVADNYIHGLVTVNDSKGSITRELILDFVKDPGSKQYSFSGNVTSGGVVRGVDIQAQIGSASAGSEGRKIPICGNSLYPTERRLYVELRRPSIARSGNHTFEYLGFGPGNYSTGFPLRQEVVLSDVQDFYAQAKRENGGIVFYTGLNSNGDLYIGNRKINAITGEETFLETAALVSSSDETDSVGATATTFDSPVVFNNKVSFLAPNKSMWPIFFSAPILIEVRAFDTNTNSYSQPAIDIVTSIRDGFEDRSLLLNSKTNQSTGNIQLAGNRIKSAIFQFNNRGSQPYSIRTAIEQTTPNQLNSYGSQAIDFGSRFPLVAGDILLKGEQVGLTGSLGWIYANNFLTITHTSQSDKLSTLQRISTANIIRLNWGNNPVTNSAYTNAELGIISSSFSIRISGSYISTQNITLNFKTLGTWSIYNTTFATSNRFIDIQVNDAPIAGTYQIGFSSEPNIAISYSSNSWKEVGVIGAESIRTETESIGNYRVGINTVARAATSAYLTGFVDPETTAPRANLDIVGNAYISGKSQPYGNFFQASTNKTEIGLDNAFLVGGNSVTPDNIATLRVATTNGGKVGINTTSTTLDRSLVVVGDGRITGDFKFQSDIEVSGGDITTTSTSFNLLNQNTLDGTLNVANYASIVAIANNSPTLSVGLGNYSTESVSVNIGNAAKNLIFKLGNNSTESVEVGIGNAAKNLIFNLGNNSTSSVMRISNNLAPTSNNVSKVNIGGAFNNTESLSYVSLDSNSTRIAGDLTIGYTRALNQSLTVKTSAGTVNFFNTITSTLNFGGAVSKLVIGGQGGSTRIRNSLTVDGSLTTNSNITLKGGLLGLTFTGTRAQLGSTKTSHTGTLSVPLINSVDVVSVITANSNNVDTAGNGNWGSSGTNGTNGTYQQSFISAGITLPALSGNYYYLPLKYAPIGDRFLAINDFLIINSAPNPSENGWPEIVQIVELSQIPNNGPYWIKVLRTPLGSFLPKPNYGHLDETVIHKADIQFNATWATNNLNNIETETVSTVSVAEIGGTINAGDYIIIDRSNIDSIEANGYESGEAIKITTSSYAVAKKFSINNGASPNPLTFFSVDSTNGNTIIGNPSLANSGDLTINGNINLTGKDCGINPLNSFQGLIFKKPQEIPTLTMNSCTGDVVLGSESARVFALGGYAATNRVGHSVGAIVNVFTNHPLNALSSGGIGFTELATNFTVTSTETIIQVKSILGFAKDNYIFVYVNDISPGEVMKITGTPYSAIVDNVQKFYIPVQRGQAGTDAKNFSGSFIVLKVNLDDRTTTLLEAVPAGGSRLPVGTGQKAANRVSLYLKNGNLISPKLDYQSFMVIDKEIFLTTNFHDGGDANFGTALPKSTRIPNDRDAPLTNYYGGGNLTTQGNFEITGGNLRMYGSDGKTLVFNVSNDDGHAGDGSLVDVVTQQKGLFINGPINVNGDFILRDSSNQERQKERNANGQLNTPLMYFETASKTLKLTNGIYVDGVISQIQSATKPIIQIMNLGSAVTNASGLLAGPRNFTMYQDGSIDAFGIKQYFTANGGRRWTYISANITLGQNQLNPLKLNNNYLINCSTNMVLYLPSTAATGDMIRFLEISGNLQYNTNLVIRANKNGTEAVAIQGDKTGTKISSGAAILTTAWDSGELIVQTRNAGFGLVYVGNSDSPGDAAAESIPTDLQGWWLVEL